MQKIIIFLMAATMLLTITACGNAEEQKSPQPESSTAEESSAPNLAVEPHPEQSDVVDSPSAQEEAFADAQLDNDAEPETSAILSEQVDRAPVIDAESEQFQESTASGTEVESLRIKLSFGGNKTYATLYDTPPSRDLLSRLPLTLEFQDYVGTEKISYLDQALTDESGPNAPSTGDFAYYAPWGNLAIFYSDIPSAGAGLVILGSMESGKELLAGMSESFTVTIERVN